jgi:hypothetical protein
VQDVEAVLRVVGKSLEDQLRQDRKRFTGSWMKYILNVQAGDSHKITKGLIVLSRFNKLGRCISCCYFLERACGTNINR